MAPPASVYWQIISIYMLMNPVPAVVGDENQGRRLMIRLPGHGNSGKEVKIYKKM